LNRIDTSKDRKKNNLWKKRKNELKKTCKNLYVPDLLLTRIRSELDIPEERERRERNGKNARCDK